VAACLTRVSYISDISYNLLNEVVNKSPSSQYGKLTTLQYDDTGTQVE
jgi:hypothetical protein